MWQLREYQEKLVVDTSMALANGRRKLIIQLPTGAGKTICFSAITDRWLKKQTSAVIILVHRKELLQQTRRTLFDAFGISAQPIVAGMRHIPNSKVYVGMIESAHRRIAQIKNIGLVIIDEAHLANFFKIHEFFPIQYILGFTATPWSANKKKPLKDYFDDIITTIQVKDLIKLGSLCQNIMYAPRDIVERASLTVKGGDFDEGFMATKFSAPKYVDNTVKAYREYANGSKAIIFNVNVEHSKKVNNAFKIAGYDSLHVDGSMNDSERKYILKKFSDTPGTILNNVGIATTGTDIPSAETGIMNKATKSPIIWNQCLGRTSRPTDIKVMSKHIDMGGNWCSLGDWCDDRDWHDIFHNPPKTSKKEQVAPCKSCPQCDAILPASVRLCSFCGYEFPSREETIEGELSDFIIVTKGINVAELIATSRGKKEYYPFFHIGKKLADSITGPMTDEKAAFALTKYEELAKEWCHEIGKRFNQWHKDRAREHLYALLAERFKDWQNPAQMLDLTWQPPSIHKLHNLKILQPLHYEL